MVIKIIEHKQTEVPIPIQPPKPETIKYNPLSNKWLIIDFIMVVLLLLSLYESNIFAQINGVIYGLIRLWEIKKYRAKENGKTEKENK